MKWYGIAIIGMLIVHGHLATRFFGNHWFPQSEAEVISDGICLVVLALGGLIIELGREFDKLNKTK
jgi:hypothetical protein